VAKYNAVIYNRHIGSWRVESEAQAVARGKVSRHGSKRGTGKIICLKVLRKRGKWLAIVNSRERAYSILKVLHD